MKRDNARWISSWPSRQRTRSRLISLIEAQRKAELRFERDEFRLDRDERILKLVISAGRRERRTRSEADERLTKALAVLAESQAHTDNRLDALIDIVQQQRNGG